MLIGLVAKNGILIVEFANQRREDGLSIYAAIVNAASARLRPILMTTMSTVLGTLPLVFSYGSEGRMSMGVAVVGGLLIGTFFTLFIVPAIYTYFASEKSTEEIKEKSEVVAGL